MKSDELLELEKQTKQNETIIALLGRLVSDIEHDQARQRLKDNPPPKESWWYRLKKLFLIR